MNHIKYILLFCLILFPITSKSYGLTNSWCSNGKYSKAISPFPKPQFNKCPGYAKIIMTKKEVTDYYLNGLGKDYLCKLTSNPLFFVGSKHKREDYEALKLLFKPNQVKVAVMCAQLNRTKLAKKKAEEAKQTARVNVNKGPKEWCLPQNKYQRNIPFHKLEDGNKCPSNTKEISQEKALDLILTNYDGYLNQIIVSGTICDDTYKNYKYLREMIREAKNLDCNKIKAELLKKNQEKKQKAIDQKKAEEEAKIKALAEKLAKEEIAKQLKQKEEDARKKAEELAKQKALAEKKAKEEALKKAQAKKKAEELAKQKAIKAKKVEEEALKQKVLNEKIAKIKDEAQFIVETLKEYVTTDNNKLDILEVSELLENFDNEKQKGWSDTTIEKYEALYDFVQKDDGFVTYSLEKKSKQLAAYNEEIRQLREYLSSSQSSLKEFITKNLGSKNAKEALKLAKETKAILKDFDVSNAMSLKNKIATWKAMNGIREQTVIGKSNKKPSEQIKEKQDIKKNDVKTIQVETKPKDHFGKGKFHIIVHGCRNTNSKYYPAEIFLSVANKTSKTFAFGIGAKVYNSKEQYIDDIGLIPVTQVYLPDVIFDTKQDIKYPCSLIKHIKLSTRLIKINGSDVFERKLQPSHYEQKSKYYPLTTGEVIKSMFLFVNKSKTLKISSVQVPNVQVVKNN